MLDLVAAWQAMGQRICLLFSHAHLALLFFIVSRRAGPLGQCVTYLEPLEILPCFIPPLCLKFICPCLLLCHLLLILYTYQLSKPNSSLRDA